eukprot:5744155-Pleurochrysis_carterae.AAC.1
MLISVACTLACMHAHMHPPAHAGDFNGVLHPRSLTSDELSAFCYVCTSAGFAVGKVYQLKPDGSTERSKHSLRRKRRKCAQSPIPQEGGAADVPATRDSSHALREIRQTFMKHIER